MARADHTGDHAGRAWRALLRKLSIDRARDYHAGRLCACGRHHHPDDLCHGLKVDAPTASVPVPCCDGYLHIPRERLTVGHIYRWHCDRHDVTWEMEWTGEGAVPRVCYPGDVS